MWFVSWLYTANIDDRTKVKKKGMTNVKKKELTKVKIKGVTKVRKKGLTEVKKKGMRAERTEEKREMESGSTMYTSA